MTREREVVLKPFVEQANYMNERISTGIEQHRKGEFCVTVVDENGKAVPGAKVTVHQKNHEFRYGANLFALNEMRNEDESREYKRLFADCFNLGTLPFYWKSTEPEKGKTRYTKDSPHIYRRPAVEMCLEFCEQYGIEPKAHCLDYDVWSPEWYRLLNSIDEQRKELQHHFEELAHRYASRIPSWEVTNELLFLPSDSNTLHHCRDDMLEWDFSTAVKCFPNNKLIINESADNLWLQYNGNRTAYYMLIERALKNGCRIDSIGMQFHIWQNGEEEKRSGVKFYSPENIYRVLDKFADFALPIQITEATVPCYSPDYEDEDIQAEILKNLYSIWFSHPNMEAIIYWDFVDGYTWQPYHIGFVKQDLTPKKAYNTIRDLFGKTWRTNLDAVADARGQASFKAFYGEYDITIHANGKTVTQKLNLSKKGKKSFDITV